MADYMRRPEMMEGGPFHCYNCGRKLAVKVRGSALELQFICPRCHAYIFIKMNEPAPFAERHIEGKSDSRPDSPSPKT